MSRSLRDVCVQLLFDGLLDAAKFQKLVLVLCSFFKHLSHIVGVGLLVNALSVVARQETSSSTSTGETIEEVVHLRVSLLHLVMVANQHLVVGCGLGPLPDRGLVGLFGIHLQIQIFVPIGYQI